MSDFLAGTLLAALAWLPVGAWFLRARGSGPDGWFAAAVGWGVLVVVAVALHSLAQPGTYDATPGSPPAWLLGETFLLWMTVTLMGTRRRTPS